MERTSVRRRQVAATADRRRMTLGLLADLVTAVRAVEMGAAVDSDINYMDIAEFRDFGYLQEVNRMFLHPLGLALSVRIEEDGSPGTLVGIWDYRDDPEGMRYGDDMIDPIKASNVATEWQKRQQARVEALGYMMQPVPEVDVDE